MDTICYAKYNRTRTLAFQTKTRIVQREDAKQVIKEPLTKQAKAHVDSMQKKYEWVQKLYRKVTPVSVQMEGDAAVFPYVEGETIGSLLEKLLGDKEALLPAIKAYLDDIMQYQEEFVVDFAMTEEFRAIFGEYDKNCKALKFANVDEIFDNFLIVDGKYYLIDYEWVFDFPVPVDYIRFRTVFYFYVKNGNYLSNCISLEEYLNYFGIDKDEQEAFLRLDDTFQQWIHGANRRYIYTRNYVKDTHNINGLLNQYHNIGAELSKKDADLYDKTKEIIEVHERLREKEELILMKDKNIADFRKNEQVLNEIIQSANETMEQDKKNLSNMSQHIAQMEDKIRNQEEYIALLRRCVRNPFYAVGQGVKKVAKKVLPGIVQMGLYCLYTEGTKVFFYKLKNYSNRKNQYEIWLSQNEKDMYHTEPLSYNPKISVVVPVYNVEDQQLTECIESVRNQTYTNWQLCLVDDCSTMESVRKTLKRYENDDKIAIVYRKENGHISRATNSGIEVANGDYVALLDCDDLLAPNALYEMAKKVNENPAYDFVYSDEDKLTEDGKIRKDPFFKPDWSPDTFMSLMYTCHFSMFRRTLVEELGGMRIGLEGSQDYDLVLRVMEKTMNIGHVPKILYHWRERKESTANNMTAKPYIIESTKKAKLDALERRGLKGHLECIDSITQFRVVYEPMNRPKVSIIIPSKDNYDILKQCIVSIKNVTEYDNYEIVVVDNGSQEETKAQYEALCQKYGCIYHYQPLQFNFSQMCNIGASKASGDYYLFLNDDIEIKGSKWLSILLGQAQVPYVGAVGAKLLYPDSNMIQHVGVVNLAIGPGHAFHGFDDNMNYYYGRNILDYNFSVVTGACLMVQKEKYDKIGGFDETLPVAYNDVELCFKLVEAGYYNVLRNDVCLIHHESVSRGYDAVTPEKAERQKREMAHLYELHPKFKGYDPCYNPNLVQTRGDFSFNLDNPSMKAQVPAQTSASILPDEGLEYNIDEVCVNQTVRILGWAFARENHKIGKVKLLFVNDKGQAYEVATEEVYRPDVKAQFNNYKSLAFSGFQTMFDANALASGTYEIYIQMKNHTVKTKSVLSI